MEVVGLHKLPFDEAGFARDMEPVADHEPETIAQLSKQFRENWDNAWLVVIEFEGTADDIDFGAFNYPERGPFAQAAWLEEVLESTPGRTRAAFYLHYVEPGKPLWYGTHPLKFPAPTPMPRKLIEQVPYMSPD